MKTIVEFKAAAAALRQAWNVWLHASTEDAGARYDDWCAAREIHDALWQMLTTTQKWQSLDD